MALWPAHLRRDCAVGSLGGPCPACSRLVRSRHDNHSVTFFLGSGLPVLLAYPAFVAIRKPGRPSRSPREVTTTLSRAAAQLRTRHMCSSARVHDW